MIETLALRVLRMMLGLVVVVVCLGIACAWLVVKK